MVNLNTEEYRLDIVINEVEAFHSKSVVSP